MRSSIVVVLQKLPRNCRKKHYLPSNQPTNQRTSVRMTVKSINRRVDYWAICSSVRLFTRTAHSFACFALLASLARSAALIRSLARSLTRSRAHGIVYDPMSHFQALLNHSALPQRLCDISVTF